jgi:hypothetical protein
MRCVFGKALVQKTSVTVVYNHIAQPAFVLVVPQGLPAVIEIFVAFELIDQINGLR